MIRKKMSSLPAVRPPSVYSLSPVASSPPALPLPPPSARQGLTIIFGPIGAVLTRIPVRLLVVALISLLLVGNPQRQDIFIHAFLSFSMEALPFLLLGALMAAALELWPGLTRRLWARTRRHWAGAAATGVALGFALPVCECGTAPVARQALRDGAPAAAGLTFLLAAPVINPVTILVTWIAFRGDWTIVGGRIGLALVVAFLVSFCLSLHPQPQTLFRLGPAASAKDSPPRLTDTQTVTGGETEPAILLRPLLWVVSLARQAIPEFFQTAGVAMPGLILAAAFRATTLPREWAGFGQGALLSAVALMLLAAVLAICSSVDAFVALSFASLFPTGSLLAFLVFGPIINVKSLSMLRLVLCWRSIGLIAILSFQVVLLSAVVINQFLV